MPILLLTTNYELLATFTEDKGMSTPAAPNPPVSPPGSASHPTRQLLDELDALMQRMLALPVNQLEEELRTMAEETSTTPTGERPVVENEETARTTAPEGDSPKASPGGPDPDGPPAVGPARADGAAEVAPPHAPLASFQPLPAAEQGSPLAPSAETEAPREKADSDWERLLPAGPEVLAALGRPAPKENADHEVRIADRGAPIGEGLTTAQPSTRLLDPPSSLWLRPVLWINQVFDWCTPWLGRPGRWLRGPVGRALLGWVGLGLLAGAAAWLLAYRFGWTP
jgi:hypothetical protein